MQVLYSILLLWTIYYFIIIILFIQYLIYFIHLAIRTHVSSCVRDGINHLWFVLIIL
jgi:hypothetical protein